MRGKYMTKKTTKADNFAETLKDNPKEIIEWAEAEIREYQRLIAILKKEL